MPDVSARLRDCLRLLLLLLLASCRAQQMQDRSTSTTPTVSLADLSDDDLWNHLARNRATNAREGIVREWCRREIYGPAETSLLVQRRFWLGCEVEAVLVALGRPDRRIDATHAVGMESNLHYDGSAPPHRELSIRIVNNRVASWHEQR